MYSRHSLFNKYNLPSQLSTTDSTLAHPASFRFQVTQLITIVWVGTFLREVSFTYRAQLTPFTEYTTGFSHEILLHLSYSLNMLINYQRKLIICLYSNTTLYDYTVRVHVENLGIFYLCNQVDFTSTCTVRVRHKRCIFHTRVYSARGRPAFSRCINDIIGSQSLSLGYVNVSNCCCLQRSIHGGSYSLDEQSSTARGLHCP